MNYIKIFPTEKNVLSAFSKKEANDLKNNILNQTKFFNQFNLDLKNVVRMNQVHGINIEYANGKSNLIKNTDGIFTDKKRIFLAVNTADCLPIFIYGQDPKFVGIIHAGWRGMVNGIIKNFFEKAANYFDLVNIKIVIGPCIHLCCFEIKADCLLKFKNYKKFINKKNEKFFVDLPAIAKAQLTKIGILSHNIKVFEDCTCCAADKYFSYRREKKDLEGEMLGFIGLI